MWIFMNYDNSIIIVSFENGFYRIVYDFFMLHTLGYFFELGSFLLIPMPAHGNTVGCRVRTRAGRTHSLWPCAGDQTSTRSFPHALGYNPRSATACLRLVWSPRWACGCPLSLPVSSFWPTALGIIVSMSAGEVLAAGNGGRCADHHL
jgi:hypothetical protein